jgi:HAD superfamily hydrolase (TIGR01549 family)
MTAAPPTIVSDITSFRLFIFDLDGTLYDQNKVRRAISLNLFLKLLTFRAGLLDLRIISTFRRERENHKSYASPTIEQDQFSWCASVLGISVERVRKSIGFWMYKFPLSYLIKARYPHVEEFFSILVQQGKKIIVYSDFQVDEKLKALGLDANRFFCATDPEILQLKPSGKALLRICQIQGCSVDEAIFIGDRDDTDGESAREAGMNYLIIDSTSAREGKYYQSLMNQFSKNNDQR